jgi:Lipopolysaccharide-assembly
MKPKKEPVPTEQRNAVDLFLYFKFRNLRFEMSHFFSSLPPLRFSPLCLCVCVAILFSGCGYHVAGTASRLPAGLKVIAVPTIENRTNRYRIEQLMTEAVVHEFLARTKYRIVPTEDNADAVLHGEISSFDATPVVFDTTPGPNSTPVPNVNATTTSATTMLVSVHMKVWLEERETKRILYKNDNYLFREPYELSTDPTIFFDEQSPAMKRMSRDFASRLVADIVENF